MAWTNSKRNVLITGATQIIICGKVAWNIKDALASEGWTVIGSGDGSTFNWGGSDLWVSAPSLSGSWVGLENADGLHLLLQIITSGSDYAVYMAWSESGGYTGTGANATTLPDRSTPPTDEVIFNQPAYTRGAINTTDFYLQVTTSDDDCSFYSWAKFAGVAYYGFGAALVKLTNLKPTDMKKYWGWRFAQSSAPSAWIHERLNEKSGGSPAFCGKCIHPVGGSKDYRVLELSKAGATVTFVDLLPVDPVSTKEQLIECLVGCAETTYFHLKGELPDMLRCSRLRSVGDTFDSYKYVCVGDYVLPWGSATSML